MHHCCCILLLVKVFSSSDAFAFVLLSAVLANDVTGLKESEEKLKQQQQESARRENILVMRLATKEQEMQECTVCISSLTFSVLTWLWGIFDWKGKHFVYIAKCFWCEMQVGAAASQSMCYSYLCISKITFLWVHIMIPYLTNLTVL